MQPSLLTALCYVFHMGNAYLGSAKILMAALCRADLFRFPRDLFESNAMSKEKMKHVVIHLTLYWFELQIKTQGKYHLPFFPASQSSVRCCKIVANEGLSKFMSFLQKNRIIYWNVVATHWCKPLQKGFI